MHFSLTETFYVSDHAHSPRLAFIWDRRQNRGTVKRSRFDTSAAFIKKDRMEGTDKHGMQPWSGGRGPSNMAFETMGSIKKFSLVYDLMNK